ncbi:hypothetical protein C8R34_101288 [Nitrosomonas sp. Nm84]|nr:hypothetical protein C8R34_101288 [Nitrosomonas sp. Nm84]
MTGVSNGFKSVNGKLTITRNQTEPIRFSKYIFDYSSVRNRTDRIGSCVYCHLQGVEKSYTLYHRDLVITNRMKGSFAKIIFTGLVASG